MRTARNQRPRHLVLAVLLLMAPAHYTVAQIGYEVDIIFGVDCGIFGIEGAVGQGINDHGMVVGYVLDCNLDEDPFAWSDKTGLTVLDLPDGFVEGRAIDVNNRGQIVGRIFNNKYLAALWENGNVTNLGTLRGGDSSEPRAINNSGQIAGFWGNINFGPFPLAFLYEDGEMIDISGDFGRELSQANDINDLGQVTGWMGTSPLDDARAFIWDDGDVIELPAIPGGFTSEGVAINNHGHVAVVGRIRNGDSFLRRSFLWRDGRYIDLGTLPGRCETIARDMNDDDVIIGLAQFAPGEGGTEYFVWRNGVIRVIDDFVVSDDPAFTAVDSAWRLNQDGAITGDGAYMADELVTSPAIRLRPIEVLNTPDLDGDGVVGTGDLMILLGSWGDCPPRGDCPADLNGDNTVNAVDLIALLGRWGVAE